PAHKLKTVNFERRLLVLSFLASLPALATALVLLCIADLPNAVRLAIALSVVAATLFIVQLLHHRITFPLHTLANVVGGMREEDYSLRTRGAAGHAAAGDVT